MAQYDGSIRINTKINTEGVKRGVSDIKSQFNSLTHSLKKIGSLIATAFAVNKIVQFGKEMIELGSDLQEVQNVVDVTFTSMSKNVDEFARNASISAGLSETMAKKYVGTFGAMAKSFGFAEEESYSMSTALTQLAGDVASFYNITQDEAYTKLKSVFTGETETLKDLGVVMTQSALDSYAMANGFGKTTSAMTEQEKVALRYKFVIDQLSGASGDFIRTSDGWANQVRVLKLQIESLKATIGQGLINVFTPVIKVINILLGKLATLANAFKSFTQLLTGKKSSSGSGAGIDSSSLIDSESGYDKAADAADNLASSTQKVAKATKDAKKAADGYLSPLDEINRYSEEKNNVSSAENGVVPNAGITGSIENVDYGNLSEGETVVDKLDKKLLDLKETLSGLIKPFQDAWGTEGKATIDSIQFALSNLMQLAKSVGKSFYDVWTNGTGKTMLETMLQIGSNVLGVIGNIALKLQEAWDKNSVGTGIIQNIANIYQRVLDFVNGIWQSTANWAMSLDFYPILESIKNLTEKIEPIVKNIGDLLLWIYKSIILPMAKYLLETAIPFLINKISELFKFISSNQGVIEAIGAGLLAAFAAKKVISGITSIIGAVKNFMSLIKGAGGLLSLLTGTGGIAIAIGAVVAAGVLLYQNWDEICAAGKKIWNDLKDFLSRTWDNIKTNASNMWKGITGFLGKTWEGLKSTASSVFSGIGDVAKGAWDGISKSVSSLCQIIQSNFPKAFNAAVSIIKKPINGIISLINGLINGVVTGINYVLSAFNHLRISVPSWVPGIGGKKLGFNFGMLTAPQIPYLATGAVIPPNAPFMAVLGDQKHGTNIEAPLSVIEDAVERALSKHQNTGGNGNYTFIGQINRRVLFEEVISEAVIQQTVRGKNPFLLGG